MRALLSVSLLALLVPLGAAQAPAAMTSPASPFAKDSPDVLAFLESASKEIKGENVYACIEEVTQTPPTMYRLMGTPTHDQFVAKYANVFSSISPRIKSQVVHFSNGGAVGVSQVRQGGDNILGVLPGKDLTKWIVLGGHYDNREGTVGAIDNASGICTVKELARVAIALDLQPEATIVFAWWDGEEWGLYGSTNFVRDHSATKELLGLPKDAPVTILVGQSWDIVGINYPAYNTWINYGQPTEVMEYATLNLRTAPTERERFTLNAYRQVDDREDFDELVLNFSAYAGLVKEVAHVFLKLPPRWANVHNDQYGRSDQVPFIAAGIPGMRIQGSHDGQWPHYHQPTDTLPFAITMAGSRENLVAGFATAAKTGGLTALYVARQGSYGMYSNVTAEPEPEAEPNEAKSSPGDTPGFGTLIAVGATGLIAAFWRRRGPG